MKRGKSRGRETSKKVLAIFMVREDGVMEHVTGVEVVISGRLLDTLRT